MRPHKDISGKEQMANGQVEQMVDLNSRKSYKDAAHHCDCQHKSTLVYGTY